MLLKTKRGWRCSSVGQHLPSTKINPKKQKLQKNAITFLANHFKNHNINKSRRLNSNASPIQKTQKTKTKKSLSCL
jgi:hypothetical protein